MTKKIVELVQERDFETLKVVLEEKLAKKIKEKIDEKKAEFITKCKGKKEKILEESDHVFSEKLYTELNKAGLNNHGGIIPFGDKWKVMVDVTGNDVEVSVLKGKSAGKAVPLYFDSTPITKGLSHAVSFIKAVVNEIVYPDYKKDKSETKKDEK